MLQLLETCTVQYCTGTFFFFIISEIRFKYSQKLFFRCHKEYSNA